ncbi:D-2-hydroxyacid dehydrogenase [Robiginitalea sp.]|uniref:D-2-hydroxyacid dehydrogenase n=1 Tax=Robiginitalea sp. TaxID=1902411 RepID=UPI003C4263BA
MVVLANDGITSGGQQTLEQAGFEVQTVHVAQEQLANYLIENKVSALLVRSATQVGRDIIDACPELKLIGRGGVGMDNIAVTYAREKGIHVINTPAASSDSVAELVFAHLAGGVRYLHEANRLMPLEGEVHFKALKKSFAGGTELRGKTLGVIGFGRIGKAVARIALGVGMNVIYNDVTSPSEQVEIPFYDGRSVRFDLETIPFEDLLEQADFITLHVPAQKKPVIGAEEIEKMKKGAALINTSRGGIVDEVALVDALEAGKLSFAALDVFTSEPKPEIQILMQPKMSLSPHIGASTAEAQERIGEELAQGVIRLLQTK